MTLAYLPRLICLTLACFFLVNILMTVVVAVFSRRAIRKADRFPPRKAASFILGLRLVPVGLAAFAAIGLCVPSYMWFEPERVEEHVGFFCLALAFSGLAILGVATTRALRAVVESLIFFRRCRHSGNMRDDLGALVIASSRPLIALAGVVRPRLIMSQGIVDALNGEELAVVMVHERAHRESRDNLKRLCMTIAPGFASLDRAWVRLAEFAADEQAVAGDEKRALALASALVRVARVGQNPGTPRYAISFLGNACDLSDRVDRLLAPRPFAASARPRTTPLWISVVCLAAISFNPFTLRWVQSALEELLH